MAYRRQSPQPVIEGGTGAQTETQHGVLIGNGTSAITATTAGTTGQVLTGVTSGPPTFQSPAASSITITGDSGGGLTGASFTFTGGTSGLTFAGSGSTETLGGTLVVANGGTGRATLTAHGVLIGNGTTAITQLAVAATGATLMGSTGADPAFTGSPSFSGSVTAGTSITASSGAITATSGNVVITSGNLTLAATSSASIGNIIWGGTRFLHNYGSGITAQNVFLGYNAGNYTLTTGSCFQNTCVGASTGLGLTTATLNTIMGDTAGQAITSGSLNTVMGGQAGISLITGANNTLLGAGAGENYSGSESSNVCINSTGTAAESNVCRIGAGTGTGTQQLNSTYISGITGITVTGTAVLVSTTNQLGIAVSSAKYKTNIVDMDDISDKIKKLRPVNFNYKDKVYTERQSGLIAEEVYEVMPELVVLHPDGTPQSVRYHDLPVLLLSEIQKLRKEIELLKEKK